MELDDNAANCRLIVIFSPKHGEMTDKRSGKITIRNSNQVCELWAVDSGWS